MLVHITTRCMLLCVAFWLVIAVPACSQSSDTEALNNQATAAMKKAVSYFHEKVAVNGGYVYRVSSDLNLQEGEGVTDNQTVWVQPPGTPAVGMAYLTAYERTGESYLLEAAKDAAHCLLNGQLKSGGWQDRINFEPQLRNKQAYRVDSGKKKNAKNISSFDDDKTQSAIRFLARYDRATEFRDEKVHEATLFALDSILKNQFPNGGFGQVFEQPPDPNKYTAKPASFPNDWPRKYPGGDYWWYYTLNDNNLSRIIDTLVLASEIYQRPEYRKAAIRTGEFLLSAQMPEPQPAWAQQYDFDMQPVWARKFEPAAISGGESQEVVRTLMKLYQITSQKRFLEPIPKALDYLQNSEIQPGKLARFYELKTNRPLYMTRQYELTYESNDLPTHYGFIVTSGVKNLRQRYDRLVQGKHVENSQDDYSLQTRRISRPSDDEVRKVIEAMDQRGAWVEKDRLIYHKTESQPILKSETFIRNLDTLSRFLSK